MAIKKRFVSFWLDTGEMTVGRPGPKSHVHVNTFIAAAIVCDAMFFLFAWPFGMQRSSFGVVY